MEIDVNDTNFKITDSSGKEINCTLLYELADEKNGKIYIAYTDYVTDENGKYRIIIAELLNNDTCMITPIEDKNIENAIKQEVNKIFIQN